MENTCQQHYEHSIPAEKSSAGVRYNLTFRYIVPELRTNHPKGKSIIKITEKYNDGLLKGGTQHMEDLLNLNLN